LVPMKVFLVKFGSRVWSSRPSESPSFNPVSHRARRKPGEKGEQDLEHFCLARQDKSKD
jgi:hypothetical protein